MAETSEQKKARRAVEGAHAMAEYRANAEAALKRMAQLSAARLARVAATPPVKPAPAKPASAKPPKTKAPKR